MPRKDPLAALYAGPIESFTAARKKLAAKLAANGDRALAAKVRGAAKPTRAAWVLVRLPHEAADELKALYAAGDRMRKSQHGSASEAAKALRDATAARAKALASLERAAKKILAAKDYAAPHSLLRSVTNVLRNASVDDSVREQLASGVIAKTDEIESDALPSFAAAVKRPREREGREHAGPVPAIRAGSSNGERVSETSAPDGRTKARLHLVPRESTATPHRGPRRPGPKEHVSGSKSHVATKRKLHAIDTRALHAAERHAASARRELDRAMRAVHVAEERMRAAETKAREADERVRSIRGR